MKKQEIIKFLILRTVGNFLVLFAIYAAIATFGPALYFEVNYRIAQARGVKYVISQTPSLPDTTSNETSADQIQPQDQQISSGVDNFAQVLLGAKEQVLVAKDTKFGLLIPKIGASAKVFANVNPGNQEEFLPILAQGVAHAQGTVFPGITGNIYLFAHSTDNFWNIGRYNAIFYLLKDLVPGDEVVVFYQNKRYDYIVSGSEVVSPEDVSHIVDAQNVGEETLILQTCWPPGTTFQRLLVYAKPK
ncbi:MAG: class E sortase [Candidatus Levybacteria bacterium]|nr:class E sortase [Candidatus Levybacteria bacterium]